MNEFFSETKKISKPLQPSGCIIIKTDPNKFSKRESFMVYDEKTSYVGPFDISTLRYLTFYGYFLPTQIVVEQNSSTNSTIEKVLSEKTDVLNNEENFNEIVFWKIPHISYFQLSSRLLKCFQSRQSLTQKSILSLSQLAQVSLGSFQDFDQYLEDNHPISQEILSLNLNVLSHQFANWLYSSLISIKCSITPIELKNILLESNPSSIRNFFSTKISSDSYLSKIISNFNQWRVFIPIYEENS